MLQGRQIQQAAIDALLEQAGAGASGALVLRGEPGIGKTALLDYAAERASGQMPALRAVGIESEAELPFAGLHQLVRPAMDRLGALPGPQSSALAAAFGLAQTADGPTSAGDRFLVGVGALSLLAELAPVLCLIDDAHWLDRASVEAMLFAARRLHRDGIVMIFTSRDYPGAFPAPASPTCRSPAWTWPRRPRCSPTGPPRCRPGGATSSSRPPAATRSHSSSCPSPAC
jgi:predicted ATPase